MLFALFAFTSFASTSEFTTEKHYTIEQTVKDVDLVTVSDVYVDSVFQVQKFKKNFDAVTIENYVLLGFYSWHNYHYSENLIENYNLQFKDQVFSGAEIMVRN